MAEMPNRDPRQPETLASVKRQLSAAIDELEDTVTQQSDALFVLQAELAETNRIIHAMSKRIDRL